MKNFSQRVAVITGAASGFGREFARTGAQLGMRLVLADVQKEALAETAAELEAQGAEVITQICDVRKGEQVEALGRTAMTSFGAVHLVFNNAGVGAGGLVWESTQADWEWVLGVNLWGVIHGVRVFTPLMLASARQDPAYEGHIVNTASMAGLLNPPTMGVYNVSKHAVVSLTESLYHDLSLVEAPIGASVLCPYFVQTGISQSHHLPSVSRCHRQCSKKQSPPARSARQRWRNARSMRFAISSFISILIQPHWVMCSAAWKISSWAAIRVIPMRPRLTYAKSCRRA